MTPGRRPARRPAGLAGLAGLAAWAGLVALVGLAAACGGAGAPAAAPAGSSAGPPASSASPVGPVTVFAAASLTGAFTALGTAFQAAHPGSPVRLSFAGSPSLVAQVQQGAPADVLATADESSMAGVGGSLAGPPRLFAANSLAIVTAAGNPRRLLTLADLARPGVTLVLAGPTVPAGRAARAALSQAGVSAHPVSEEPDVKAVLGKVRLGEADAGIVYVTDVKAAGSAVTGIPVAGVRSSYPIAVLRAAPHPATGRSFQEFVLSAQGQRVLASYGFLPPP